MGQDQHTASQKEVESWHFVGRLHFFVLLFCFVATLSFGIYSVLPEGDHLEVPWYVSAIAFAFAAACLWGLLQGGCTIDSRQRVIERWWGCVLPLYRRRIPFDSIEKVEVFVGARTRHRTQVIEWYDVTVRAEARRTRLLRTGSPAAARALGERLARTIDCPCNVDDSVQTNAACD